MINYEKNVYYMPCGEQRCSNITNQDIVFQENQINNKISCTRYYVEQRLYLYNNNEHFIYWYCIVYSNNGELSEGELNYQTCKIDSNMTASTMKWKI